MVTEDEVAFVGDLIGQFDVGIAQGLFINIGFIDQLAVDVDVAVVIDIDPASRAGDAALNQKLVAVVKGNDVAPGEIGVFDRQDDVAFDQRGGHGIAVDLQYRHPQCGDQYGDGGDGDQRVDGTFEYGAVSAFVAFPPELALQLPDLGGSVFHVFLFMDHGFILNAQFCHASARFQKTFRKCRLFDGLNTGKRSFDFLVRPKISF